MGDLPATPAVKPDLVYSVESISPPEGHGVILTILRRLPADGTWEIAFAGQWGHEWRRHMYEECEVPELDENGLVPEDWDDACSKCGHDDVRDDRTRIVFARPVQSTTDSTIAAVADGSFKTGDSYL